MAKARFDRPSIFGRVCPRRIDRDLAVAEGRLGAGDVRGAREALLGLLQLEPQNTRARLDLAQCEVRDGALEAAIRRYRVLASDPRLSVLERATAFEGQGDVQVMARRPELAVAAYAKVKQLDADEDRQRSLEVKMLAAFAPETAGVRELLIGDAKSGPSWDEAAPALGAEAALGDPLSQYLLGRNLWLHGRAAASLRELAAALDGSPVNPRDASYSWPPPMSVIREALRLQVTITCSDPNFDPAPARDAARRLREDPGVPAAKKQAIQRFAERCGF